ncbi:MAG: nitrate reductase [Chloroflexi bacterium]|nr:nitrate reductase [Chloroflexota bacterium]
MNNGERPGFIRSARILIVALIVILIIPGLALVFAAISNSVATSDEPRAVNVLAQSTDACVTCHNQTTPGIVEQYGHSTMAAANVTCSNCHEVTSDYPGAIAHEGTFVVNSPSPAMCQDCHANEVAQFAQSRHSLPAYVAMVGIDSISPELLEIYQAIPEVTFGPIQQRAVLFDIEGPDITRFACETCHNVGAPQPDGSIGQCQKCHLRHEFSLEQARKPETCNACHIGPDHPQWEIYQESPHGIAYMTGGDDWHWEAEPGTLTTSDFPAPTCATCHFSGFGASGTTHDVGDRLTWYLFAPISERRPAWQDNLTRMQSVCRECHNANFIADFYADADRGTEAINALVQQGRDIVAPLREAGLLTSEPFDEPIDFVDYELWHHWGRTAKFGMWMQGADYTQWHGAYEMLADLAELRVMAEERMGEPETTAGAQATAEADFGGPVVTPEVTLEAGG